MNFSLKKLFLLALLLRLLIAPWFYHPDLKSQHFHFQFLSNGIVNIYSFLANNKSHLPYTDTFNYLPLTYFTFGTFQTIAKPFLPSDFTDWINDWGPNQYARANLPVYLLILKLPYMLLDLALGFLLYRLFPKTKYYLFWLFNPVSLYLIYVLGNFDILPVFLTFLSLYWLLGARYVLSGLLLGLAISFKFYPFLLLPPVFISLISRPKILARFLISLFLPLCLTILPFASSPDFWHSFFGSGLTQKVLELTFLNIPVFPPLFLLILLFYRRRPLYFQYTLIGILFLATVHFHPQWLLWFFPFMLPVLLSRRSYFLLSVLIFLCFFGYVFLFNDQFLFWGHLIPISGQFLNQTSLYDFIRLRYYINPALIQNYFQIVIALCFLLFCFFFFPRDKANSG